MSLLAFSNTALEGRKAVLAASVPPLPTYRREALVGTLGAGILGLGAGEQQAGAFANRIGKRSDGPPRVGPKPDLGFKPRGGEGGTNPDLLGCKAAPNCFSSASGVDEEHFLKPWRYSGYSSDADAFAALKAAVDAYPPGQRDIDGGGFEVQTADASTGYLYVQFESLKKAFIDDVEFAQRPDPASPGQGQVLVRSASRVGYLDIGVNAKRLNKIMELLPAERWQATKISPETHSRYVQENR